MEQGYPRGINFWFARRVGRRFYYGWAIVLAVLLGNLSVFSLNPMFGLFVTPLEHEFGWQRNLIARTITLGTVAGALLLPLLGYLIDRIGTRLLTVAFGLGAGLCYLLSTGVSQVWQFNLVVGMIYPLTWIGVGQMMGAVNVNRWFVRRRGRALGTVMAGASGGSVIFIPICTLLINSYGWRAAMLALGGFAVLLISLPAFLLLVNTPEQLGLGGHPELQSPGAPGAAGAAAGAGGAGVADGAAGAANEAWSLAEAARTRTFWLTALGLMLGTFAVQGYFVHAVPHMEARGFSRVLAGAVWTSFFVTGVLAKFSWGFVIERIGVRRALVALYIGEALGLYLLLTAASPLGLFAYAIINGILHAPYLQLQAMVWAEYFGRQSFGRIYGVVQPALFVSGSLGPWVGGYLFDLSGDYTLFFHVSIALCLAAMVVLLIAPPPRPRVPAAARSAPA
jgi:MFS family permease